MPFDLVQENLLNDYKSELQELENELTSIGSSYDEILESIDEEDKGDFINEDGTAFVPKEIAKLVKSYKKVKIEEGSLESKIVKVYNLNEEETNTIRNSISNLINIENKIQKYLSNQKPKELPVRKLSIFK